jgi:hypothetical protein
MMLLVSGEQREADYVLGTHDDEVARLGLQHRVWRSVVTECWHRVGITHGWRVIDVGAGPGYATADLAEIVGPTEPCWRWSGRRGSSTPRASAAPAAA